MKEVFKYKMFFFASILIFCFSCKNSDNEIVVKKLYKDVNKDTVALNGNLYKIRKNNGYVIAELKKDSFVIISDTLYHEIYASGNSVLLRKGNKYGTFDDWKETFILPKYDVISNTSIHKEFLVTNNQKAGIINYENDTIIPLNYDRVYNLKYSENNYYSYSHYVVEKRGKCGLFQTDKKHLGKLVLPLDYDIILSISKQDSNAIVSIENKYGVVKLHSNRVIIPIIYDKIQKKDDCYYLFKNDKIGVVFLENLPERLKMFDEIINYNSKNKSIVFRNSKKKGIYDIVNNKIILDAKYDNVEKVGWNCNNEWYRLLNNNKYGLINIDKPKDFIPCLYDEPIIYHCPHKTRNEFVVKQKNKYGIIDKNNNLLIPIKYDFLYQNYKAKNSIVVVKQGKYGVINGKNNIKIPFEYERVEFLDDNSFKVRKNNKYGIVDRFNRVEVPLEYNYIFAYENGSINVHKNGKEGVVNSKGREIIPTIYDYVSFHKKSELFIVKQDNKTGIITSKGEIIIQPSFNRIEIVNQNLFLVTDNGNSFFIDKNLKIESSLFEIHKKIKLDQTDCYISSRNNLMGVISNKNGIIIPFDYDSIVPIHKGYSDYDFIASKKKKYGLIDKNNKIIIECKYLDFSIYNYNRDIFLFDNNKTINYSNYYKKIDTINGKFIGKNKTNFIFKNKTNCFTYKDNTVIECDSVIRKKNTKYELSNIIIKNQKYGYFQNKDIHLKCQFDSLTDLSNSAFLIRHKNKFGIYYANNSTPLVQPKYDSIYPLLYRNIGDLFFCYKDNKTDLYNKYGYIETFDKLIKENNFLHYSSLTNGVLLRTEKKDIVIKEQNNKYKSFFEKSNYLVREIRNHKASKNKNIVRLKDVFAKKGNIIVIFDDLDELLRNKYLITKWKLLFNTDIIFIYNQPNISEKILNKKIQASHLINEIDYLYWYPFDNLPIDKLSVYLNKDNLNFEWEDHDYLHEIDGDLQSIFGY